MEAISNGRCFTLDISLSLLRAPRDLGKSLNEGLMKHHNCIYRVMFMGTVGRKPFRNSMRRRTNNDIRFLHCGPVKAQFDTRLYTLLLRQHKFDALDKLFVVFLRDTVECGRWESPEVMGIAWVLITLDVHA